MKPRNARMQCFVLVVALVFLALAAAPSEARECLNYPDLYCWSACSWVWQWCVGSTYNAACHIHWGPGTCSTGPPPNCCGDTPGF